jgi:hypothetical protein
MRSPPLIWHQVAAPSHDIDVGLKISWWFEVAFLVSGLTGTKTTIGAHIGILMIS